MARQPVPDHANVHDREETSLVGRVTSAMRESIVSGEFPADGRLNIDALADRFGVSIIPVREALRGLATEGLVTPEANKGYRVRSASAADLEETYGLRALLDPLAVSLAVPHLSAEHIRDLGKEIDAMRSAEDQQDSTAYWRHHLEFHFGIYRHCGQSWLLRFIRSLYANSDRYRPAPPNLPTLRQDEHLAVLDACRAGDASRAASLMQEHLRHTYLMRAPDLGTAQPVGLPTDWPALDWSLADDGGPPLEEALSNPT